MINSFQGNYRFLSNFWPVEIIYEGIKFPSVEHAYVASKTLDIELRKKIALIPTAGHVKREGRKIWLRGDWEDVKLKIMEELVTQKFTMNPTLTALLKSTTGHDLIEGNTWGDTFWGQCNGVGQNNLGKILMRVRESLNAQRA